MPDNLINICIKEGVDLIYVNDQYNILSGSIKKDMSCIKASKLFMECPYTVAEAIVSFYTGKRDSRLCLGIIGEYLGKKFNLRNYRIIPPEGGTAAEMQAKDTAPKQDMDNVTPLNPGKDDTSSLTELNISSITKKDFWGGSSRVALDESMKSSSDDVMELNIVVDDIKR